MTGVRCFQARGNAVRRITMSMVVRKGNVGKTRHMAYRRVLRLLTLTKNDVKTLGGGVISGVINNSFFFVVKISGQRKAVVRSNLHLEQTYC